jgi:hypothetical protein
MTKGAVKKRLKSILSILINFYSIYFIIIPSFCAFNNHPLAEVSPGKSSISVFFDVLHKIERQVR